MVTPIDPRRRAVLHDLLEETDRGLVYDLSTLLDRRQVLKLAGFTTISAGLISDSLQIPWRVQARGTCPRAFLI